MALGFNIECPKCHADRTMLETCFGLPGYPGRGASANGADSAGMSCAVPVRLILCVRCHYLELYHDVGLGSLS
jgi:hypothetical protein